MNKLEIGKKYKIQTKNGIVEKYLNKIDKKTNCLYFHGQIKVYKSWMPYVGEVHNIKNVIF